MIGLFFGIQCIGLGNAVLPPYSHWKLDWFILVDLEVQEKDTDNLVGPKRLQFQTYVLKHQAWILTTEW